MRRLTLASNWRLVTTSEESIEGSIKRGGGWRQFAGGQQRQVVIAVCRALVQNGEFATVCAPKANADGLRRVAEMKSQTEMACES
jgi:hypothetical protein